MAATDFSTATAAAAGAPARTEPPLLSLTLWPHRSLDNTGLRRMMLLATLAVVVPLYPLIGSKAMWVIGGFLALDLLLLFGLVSLNLWRGRLRETVTIWPERLMIERVEANGFRRRWEANPHWVKLRLIETPRIPDYLVLSAAGRDVELGAFLTPEERRSLAEELRRGLAAAARASGPPLEPPQSA